MNILLEPVEFLFLIKVDRLAESRTHRINEHQISLIGTPLKSGVLKRREDEFLVEMSPRLVLGVVRLAKAHARMSLREKVTHADLKAVLDLVERSLEVGEDKESKKTKVND